MKRNLQSCSLIILTCTIHLFSQSVADVARQERERQKTGRSKIIVSGTGTVPARTSTPAAASSDSVWTDNKGHDEKYWRAAFQKARDNARRADARAETLELKIKQLNTQILQRSDIYNRENTLGTEVAAAQKELEDARREAEQAKKTIADLEEELRRSGGPPGWAR